MKTPIKIENKHVKNDILEVSFSFPKEKQQEFSMQIVEFWNVFNKRTSRIEETFLRLTKHIQSVKATQSKLRPYIDLKQRTIESLSKDINSFITINEDKTLVSIAYITKKEIAFALAKYNENASQLKTAFQYEHLYLKYMVESFNSIKQLATAIFTQYETISNEIKSLNRSYQASLVVVAHENPSIEECVLKGPMVFSNSLTSFIKKCLEFNIMEDFSELDSKGDEFFNSFLLDEYFLSNFEDQPIDVASYLGEYQRNSKIAQALNDLEDYRNYFRSKAKIKTPVSEFETHLKVLWQKFSAHYNTLFSITNDKVIANKLQKQVLTLTLKEFFDLDKNKVLEQAITDVSVDDFEEAQSFVTWDIVLKENSKFCSNFKNTFFNKYANKYELEQIQPGVFFQEKGGEFRLVFISLGEENHSVQSFIKKLELKYQKTLGNIKSVRNQKLSDVIDVSYKESKATVLIEYSFFSFRDPGLLQGLKKLESL